jgi:hypothetical protein
LIYLKDAFENAQILTRRRKSDPLQPLFFACPRPKPMEGSVSLIVAAA